MDCYTQQHGAACICTSHLMQSDGVKGGVIVFAKKRADMNFWEGSISLWIRSKVVPLRCFDRVLR